MRRKSGVSTSIVVAGLAARIAAITSGEMPRAAIVEIVAIDRGDDDMGEAELGDGFRDMRGLVRIERPRQARPHIAEGASARAGIAHDHEGRVLLLPAFADVGTARLFADGDEPCSLTMARVASHSPTPAP